MLRKVKNASSPIRTDGDETDAGASNYRDHRQGWRALHGDSRGVALSTDDAYSLLSGLV